MSGSITVAQVKAIAGAGARANMVAPPVAKAFLTSRQRAALDHAC